MFNRRPEDPISGYRNDDADIILISSATISSAVRRIVDERRKKGEKVGMIKIKMFRPFPTAQLIEATKSAEKIAVIDRNFTLGATHGMGGIFCQEVVSTLGYVGIQKLVQSYVLGIGGMDVTPPLIDFVVSDMVERKHAEKSIWKGL